MFNRAKSNRNVFTALLRLFGATIVENIILTFNFLSLKIYSFLNYILIGNERLFLFELKHIKNEPFSGTSLAMHYCLKLLV